MKHIFVLAERIIRENGRDELFILHTILTPVITLVVLKLVIQGLEGILFEFIPTENLAIGFVALLIHLSGYVICTLVIIRERITGTLERLFIATFKKSEIILGYLAGYSIVIFIQTIIVLIFTKFFFEINYGKSIFIVFLIIFLLGLASIGLAMFISNFARRESHSLLGIPLILFPAFLLSGLIFPVAALPKYLQILSYLTPVRLAISSIEGILFRGKGFFEVKTEFMGLLIYIILTLILGSITLKDRE